MQYRCDEGVDAIAPRPSLTETLMFVNSLFIQISMLLWDVGAADQIHQAVHLVFQDTAKLQMALISSGRK